MGFPTSEFQKKYSALDYRLALATYGTLGYFLSCWLTTTMDPVVYKLALEEGYDIAPISSFYLYSHKAYWLSPAIFLFLFAVPRYGTRVPETVNRNSLSYGLLVALVYFALACVSLMIFGMNPGLIIEFIGLSFILGSTEYLNGFEFHFSFAADKTIMREARIEKVRLLYRKWFSGISALVTVSIAICITAVLKLYDLAREDLGRFAADRLGQMLGVMVVYAGIGLTLGPFAQMFGVLEKIENLLDNIEAPVIPPTPKQGKKS